MHQSSSGRIRSVSLRISHQSAGGHSSHPLSRKKGPRPDPLANMHLVVRELRASEGIAVGAAEATAEQSYRAAVEAQQAAQAFCACPRGGWRRSAASPRRRTTSPVRRHGEPRRQIAGRGRIAQLRRSGSRRWRSIQAPFPADVLASSDRADRLHAGCWLGEGTGREPGRQLRDLLFRPKPRVRAWPS
jgi:hypothetical protein